MNINSNTPRTSISKTWLWFQPLSFQALWITAVMGGNSWLAVPCCLLCLHFLMSPCRRQDIRILPLAFIGISLDAALTYLGVFTFSQYPFWLLVLWFGFVLNFGHSLKLLRQLNSFWLVLIGSAGGCYAYLASWKLGAVTFPLGALMTGAVLAINWAIIFPILVKVDLCIRETRHE